MNEWPISTRVMFVTKSDLDDDCSICLSSFRNRSVLKTPCKHVFHSKCLRSCSNRCTEVVGIRTSSTTYSYYKLLDCPLCRSTIWMPNDPLLNSSTIKNELTSQSLLPRLHLPPPQHPPLQSDPWEDFLDQILLLLFEPLNAESLPQGLSQASDDSSFQDESGTHSAAQ